MSRFGDALESVALMFLVLKLTGSALAMGTVMLFSLTPNLILTPFVGVLADRYSRKKIMLISEFARGLIILWVPIALGFKILTIEQLYLVAFLVSIFETCFETANTASIPSLFMDQSELSWGYSLKSSTQSIMKLLGILIFGLVLKWINFNGIFLFDSATFLVSGVAIIFMKIPHTIETQIEHRIKDFFISLSDGFKYLKTKSLFVIITIVAAITNFIISPLQVIILYLSNNIYHIDQSYMGPILAIVLVGLALGSILFQLVNKFLNARNIIILGMLGVGCGFGIGGFIQNLYLFIGGLFILAVSSGVVSVKISTLFAEVIDDEFLGRAASVMNFFLLIGGPLSAALIGLLINYIGIGSLLKFGGYMIIGTAFLLFVLWPKNQLMKPAKNTSPSEINN